eukprot:8577433-Lingulodinium_polyedra.AAC.1
MASHVYKDTLQHGGQLQIGLIVANVDELQYLIPLLLRKFEPFADELALKGTSDPVQFALRATEKTV